MNLPGKLNYAPIEGKTYTLFGTAGSTGEYFATIRRLADQVLAREADINKVLDEIKGHSQKKKELKKLMDRPADDRLISYILHLVTPYLEPFTRNVAEHLESLPVVKGLWDRRLGTSREQYHLYMLEIELTNHLYGAAFRDSGRKIALTPYCLQDFTTNCKAKKDGDDHRCMHCSAKCFQNYGSALMEKNGVEPYIWMSADIKNLAKRTMDSKKTFGILGIACIPELMNGMRKCRAYGIPVVGLPLNANRCIRWFGEFRHNSIDLQELEKLVVT